MTHASLFSGIGGFDLAARWAGWTNMFNCEIDPFCQTVLKYHFPDAKQYSDIRTTDFRRGIKSEHQASVTRSMGLTDSQLNPLFVAEMMGFPTNDRGN